MKRFSLLYGLFFLLTVNNCFTQQFNVKTYSFGEGLSTYNIKKVVQDKYGFIWIATQDGVFRYDGTSFDPYKKTKDENSSLRENFIFDIALGNDDNLYIASFNGGVDVINVRTQKVTHLLSQKRNNEEGLPNLWITKIFCDTNNNLWIGGENFLRVYDLKVKQYKNFQHNGIANGVHISFIRSTDKNTIAVSGDKYGVLFYNISSLKITDSITKLDNEINVTISDMVVKNDSCYISSKANLFSGKIQNGIWKPGRKIEIPILRDNIIKCLSTGEVNEIWLGTNNGIGKIDLSTTQYVAIENSDFFSGDNFISDLFHDKENGLCISTLKNLIRLYLVPSPFDAFKGNKDGGVRMNHIYSLIPIDKTKLFACGSDGLYQCDLISKDVKKIKGSTALDIIHYVFKVKDDLWLISSTNGMFAYQPDKNIISKELLIQLYPEWKQYANNYFNNAVTSGNKTYWASEEQEGLLVWDIQKHLIFQYRSGTKRSGGLPEDHIHNLKYDREGFIWLLFDNAVAKFDPAIDSVKQVIRYDRSGKGFNAGIFFDMYDDGSILWFGTYGGGINGYNKKTSEWTYITEDDGLCNNAVYGILPEKDSIFWVSTNNGLSRVNYKTKRCLNYFAEDGLQDNSFDEKGALVFEDKLFFAGINGFTSIDLTKYQSISNSFPVYIKRIEYIRKNVKTVLSDLDWEKIVLPAGTSSTTIWLSALSFTGNKPRFSYKIRGYLDEYLSAGDDNSIELNALSYGDYAIDIRYINEKGEFVENTVGVSLEISPFWYQTWWFRMLVLLAILSAIFFIVRLTYISRIRKHRTLLEKQLAVQLERQRISSEMHDDIGAGLSGIKLLAEVTKGKIKDESASGEVDKIYQSVGDISAKMKEVIWSLNTENDQLSSLISYIQRQVRLWLENYPCKLSISIPENIPDVEINGESRRNILLTVKEAVHNIIKHSGADKVNINIACDKQLVISISDNGKGFHLDENAYTGNGLKNMKHRIDDLNGKFYLKNNEGSTLVFEVPIKHVS
jgi:signal transduction histidine kinase/ligand-binding sensor domain-containing protein